MKMMHGELRLACSNRSRTRLAPTPTNISTNSEPEMEKKGTPASPEIALAISVLPVPGGPTSSTPLGMRAPSDGELLRLLEELDDFLELLLGFLRAGHVRKGDGGLVAREDPRPALAEGHGLVIGALRLAHDHQEEAADEQQWQHRTQDRQPSR